MARRFVQNRRTAALHDAVSGAVVPAGSAVVTFVIVDDREASGQINGIHVAVLGTFATGDTADLAVVHHDLSLQRVDAAYMGCAVVRYLDNQSLRTGLDAGVSRVLIENLADITHKQQKTTIVISHNLSNMKLYDHAVVLVRDSKGTGRIAYAGKVNSLKQFFGTEDYGEILVKLNSPNEGGRGEADAYIKKFEEFIMER